MGVWTIPEKQSFIEWLQEGQREQAPKGKQSSLSSYCCFCLFLHYSFSMNILHLCHHVTLTHRYHSYKIIILPFCKFAYTFVCWLIITGNIQCKHYCLKAELELVTCDECVIILYNV